MNYLKYLLFIKFNLINLNLIRQLIINLILITNLLVINQNFIPHLHFSSIIGLKFINSLPNQSIINHHLRINQLIINYHPKHLIHPIIIIIITPSFEYSHLPFTILVFFLVYESV